MEVEPLSDDGLKCSECNSLELSYPCSDNLAYVCSNCGWIKMEDRKNYQDRTLLEERYEAYLERERDQQMGPAPDAESEAYAATVESMKNEIRDEMAYARELELDQWATEEQATNHPFADY